MPMQALKATLNILLFRGGPQDFPYSEAHMLTRVCFGLAALASALFFSLFVPPLSSLVAGVIAAAVLAMFTRVLLRLRKLDNRYVQTLNALFACGAILLLIMRLPASELVPLMQDYVARVQQNPELANQVDAFPKFPAGAALLVDLLSLWFIAVSSHIFRQAANLGFVSGAMIALLCQLNIMMMLLFTAPLIALFAF